MKRYFIAALAALIVLTALCGCTSTGGSSEAILAKKGLELISNMTKLAASEPYVNSLSASEELKNAINEMKIGDAPKAIYSLTMPKDAARALFLSNGIDAAFPEELTPWMESKTYAYIPTYISSQSGVATIAATSALAYSDSFVCSGLSSPVLYLYLYDSAYCVMVCFKPGQDGAVSASSIFVPCEETLRAAGDANAVAQWFLERLDSLKIDVKPIEIPKN